MGTPNLGYISLLPYQRGEGGGPLRLGKKNTLKNLKPSPVSYLTSSHWQEDPKAVDHETQSKTTDMLSGSSQRNGLYTAISRKVVGKNVHATIPR